MKRLELEKEIKQLRTEIRELRKVMSMLLRMMGEEEELDYYDYWENEDTPIYV